MSHYINPRKMWFLLIIPCGFIIFSLMENIYNFQQFYKFVFFLNLIELNLAVDRSFFISNNALFTPLLYCLSN